MIILYVTGHYTLLDACAIASGSGSGVPLEVLLVKLLVAPTLIVEDRHCLSGQQTLRGGDVRG